MIYNKFQDKDLSMLGFGAMRLPCDEAGMIDVEATKAMVAYGMENGVNYYDTAYPYHAGKSEPVMGEILKEYPRESFYLATKYPGHQITVDGDPNYDPAKIFEDQLAKCQVDYFDFYLIHNVYENSVDRYTNPDLGIVRYFVEQKKLGRIKHLGFSTHGGLDVIERFLNFCGDEMEFCQIQLNFLDWTLQNGKEKYELLTERNIPVWVMEPVRGGMLASKTEPANCFRFLQSLPNVKVVLSGMSNMEQIKDNVNTFDKLNPVSEEEKDMLLKLAEDMKDIVPCTACRYCVEGCPMELNIPHLLSIYNEIRVAPSVNASMRLDVLADDKKPEACIKCGKCSAICPQGIDIPTALEKLAEEVKKLPSWADICKQRDKEQFE